MHNYLESIWNTRYHAFAKNYEMCIQLLVCTYIIIMRMLLWHIRSFTGPEDLPMAIKYYNIFTIHGFSLILSLIVAVLWYIQ